MFDQYVSQTKPSWKRRAVAIASIGLHAVAGIVIIVWSVLHVDEITPPALTLTFLSAAPPPPPPPPPAGHKSVEHKVKPITPVTQPTQVKQIVQPKDPDPPDEDDGEEGGQEGGVKGGVAGGVVGGVVGGTLGGTGTGTAPSAPKMVASFTLMAAQLQHPDPHLPEFFRNQHAHQTVSGRYKFCLRTDGHISDVSIMTGIPGMDETVISQIKAGWTYKPQPVPVCAVAVITFKIN